jgi:hypothetical protein
MGSLLVAPLEECVEDGPRLLAPDLLALLARRRLDRALDAKEPLDQREGVLGELGRRRGSRPCRTARPAGSSSSSSSSGTTTTDDSGSGGGSADTTSEPPRDLGVMPDFGDGPAGCKGKIDFLFVISRGEPCEYRQEQLALAVPQFIDTIQAKFADFDYHIMVVDGDGETTTTARVGQPDSATSLPEPRLQDRR